MRIISRKLQNIIFVSFEETATTFPGNVSCKVTQNSIVTSSRNNLFSATVDLDMFNVPEENVEQLQDPLIVELAKILGIDPSKIKVAIIPNGNHIGVKFMILDPNFDLNAKISSGEPEKELKSWVTMDATAKELVPAQKCKFFSFFFLF